MATFNASVEQLVLLLRKLGVAEYDGPVAEDETSPYRFAGTVRLLLGPERLQLPEATSEPTEAPARGDDGLTEEERGALYMHNRR